MPDAGLLVGLGVPAFGFWLIWRLIVGGSSGVFSPLRAMMIMRTLSGENLALVLATMAIADMLLEGSVTVASLGFGSVSLDRVLVTMAVVGVVAMALMPRIALAGFALVGLIAQFVLITVNHGPTAALALLVLSILMLIVLALVRGFAR